MNPHRRYLLIVLAACMIIVSWLPAAWAADDPVHPPDAHMISDVPWHKQITALSCGAGSLEIVFDYWGPDINQKEIADVARTSSSAAGATATVSWKVRCDGDIEGQAATVTASGIIEGSMDAAAWTGNTNYYPAYDYADEIGGAGSLQF